jgi:hypothetical protein
MTAPDTLPPELAELGELVREDRPQPDERWARQLDARVAAGFPRRRRERFGWLRIRPLMPALGFAATALLVVTVAVSLPQGGDDSDEGGGGGATSSAPTIAQEDSGSAGGGGERTKEEARSSSTGSGAQPAVGGTAPPPAITETRRDPNSDRREPRRVQRSASLALAAPPDEVERVADGIGRVTDEVGGFVAASSVSSNGGDFSLRIPTARLDDALARLSRLAHVRERERRSQDITAQSVSARTRLREAQAERQSLLRQLARADTPNETAAVRVRLRTVNRQIEAARAQVRRVDNRASFADVSVTLVSDEDVGGAATDDGQWSPGDAAADAVRVLEVAVGVALVALAAALPLLLILLLAWLASRQVVRRRRDRALDMA